MKIFHDTTGIQKEDLHKGIPRESTGGNSLHACPSFILLFGVDCQSVESPPRCEPGHRDYTFCSNESRSVDDGTPQRLNDKGE